MDTHKQAGEVRWSYDKVTNGFILRAPVVHTHPLLKTECVEGGRLK